MIKSAYTKFPGRKIIETPFKKKVIVYYGIVAYAVDTQGWLLVQPASTPQMKRFLTGSYRLSEIEDLLQDMSNSEIDLLRQLTKDFTLLDKIIQDKVQNGSVEERLYAKERFLSAAPFINNLLTNLESPGCEESWSFPGGISKSKNEHPIDCALRSFTEQTGLSISESEISFFGQEPLLSLFDSCLEDRKEMRSWVCIFLKEPSLIATPPIDSITDHHDIKNVGWMKKEEAEEKLSTSQRKVLQEAERIINENFSF